tara:strand:- start:116 stop:1048 length:933 start_codon:yes stop_codon:yes gene_type:complete
MTGNPLGQVTNILSGKPKDLTATQTSGSAAGTAAGQIGLDGYLGLMDPTAYKGNIPGAQNPNVAQNQQYNMLTGMQSGYQAPGGYQDMYQNLSGANVQQIDAMDRSGGPASGYESPYTGRMIEGANRDMEDAMRMAGNMESDMAQQYSSGGPSSTRSTNEGISAKGNVGLKYADMKNKIRDTGYQNAMNWQGQDQNRNIQIANANNQSNLGFGAMNMNAANNDLNNRTNMANAFGNYGQNQQNQQNLADNFRYGEFNRMQDWKPNMLNNYMEGVRGTPWQTTQTKYGQGKSDLNNLIGMGVGLASNIDWS